MATSTKLSGTNKPSAHTPSPVSVAEHLERVLSAVAALPCVTVPLADALGDVALDFIEEPLADPTGLPELWPTRSAAPSLSKFSL